MVTVLFIGTVAALVGLNAAFAGKWPYPTAIVAAAACGIFAGVHLMRGGTPWVNNGLFSDGLFFAGVPALILNLLAVSAGNAIAHNRH